MSTALPQEMQQHTYAIMDRVEDSHWWFVGRRAILESFLRSIVDKLSTKSPRILDVGCGTGANLEMLSAFGSARKGDVDKRGGFRDPLGNNWWIATQQEVDPTLPAD